jgi:transcriptional regulator GlxA family with amidase domain
MSPFFVFADFQLLDLSGPLAAFQMAGQASAGAYSVSVVSEEGGEVASSSGIVVTTLRACDSGLDTSSLWAAGASTPSPHHRARWPS